LFVYTYRFNLLLHRFLRSLELSLESRDLKQIVTNKFGFDSSYQKNEIVISISEPVSPLPTQTALLGFHSCCIDLPNVHFSFEMLPQCAPDFASTNHFTSYISFLNSFSTQNNALPNAILDIFFMISPFQH
jgi:hypothetical protein